MEKIKGWSIFREISREIIIGVVSALMITTGAGIWAWLTELDGLYIALIVLGALCVSMVFVNQFDSFFQRRKKPLHQQSHTYIDSTLRDWLYKRGFSLRQVPPQDDKCEFVFLTKDKQERPLVIAKNKNEDEIILQLALLLKPEETAKLQNLEPEHQRKLFSELRISLARQMVAYTGLASPLKEIVLTKTLVLDNSFTRDSFLDSIDRVRYSLVLVLEILNPILERKLETEPPISIKAT